MSHQHADAPLDLLRGEAQLVVGEGGGGGGGVDLEVGEAGCTGEGRAEVKADMVAAQAPAAITLITHIINAFQLTLG